MSSLPALLTHQRLVGFAMPDWMVSPIPHTIRLLTLPNSDLLGVWMPKESTIHMADAAFQTLINKSVEIDMRADENVGKRGMSRQQYKEQYWFAYLEGLKSQEQKNILWAARSSPRYEMMMQLYQSLPDKQSDLAQLTADQIDVFTRIDRFLAISIIIDIHTELTKLKKQKKKIPAQQILAELLSEKGIDKKHLSGLFALAKKTPIYQREKTTVLTLQKLHI